MNKPLFSTALKCMDGRPSYPVIALSRSLFGSAVVDIITEPGIVRYLAEDHPGEPSKEWLRLKTEISVVKHASRGIAISAHQDCAGNPVDKATQCAQLVRAVDTVKAWFPTCKVIGVWNEPSGGEWTAIIICER